MNKIIGSMASHSRGMRHHLARDAADPSAFEAGQLSGSDDDLEAERIAEAQFRPPVDEYDSDPLLCDPPCLTPGLVSVSGARRIYVCARGAAPVLAPSAWRPSCRRVHWYNLCNRLGDSCTTLP